MSARGKFIVNGYINQNHARRLDSQLEIGTPENPGQSHDRTIMTLGLLEKEGRRSVPVSGGSRLGYPGRWALHHTWLIIRQCKSIPS